MQIRVLPAIIMLGADAHDVFCAQNDASPMLCVTREDRGVGYFNIIFRCSSLQVFKPHPLETAKLHANFV